MTDDSNYLGELGEHCDCEISLLVYTQELMKKFQKESDAYQLLNAYNLYLKYRNDINKFESKIEIAKTNGENANYINSLERNLEKATSLANGFATVFMETINAEILERILEHYERELFE